MKMINEIFKKVLLLSATISVEPKINSASREEKRPLCRASELPIYIEQDTTEKEVEQSDETEEAILQYMENVVLKSHRKYSAFCEDLGVLKKSSLESYEHTKGSVDSFLQELREKDNINQRVGFISFGTVLGLLFGVRRGIFRKILYAATGGIAATAICYPKEANEYTKLAYQFIQNSQLYQEVKLAIPLVEKNTSSEDEIEIENPAKIIKESHDEAVEKSCHCPIGACLHGPEGTPSPTEGNMDIPLEANT